MESLEPLSPVEPAAGPFPGLYNSARSSTTGPDAASNDADRAPSSRRFSQDLASARQAAPPTPSGPPAKNPDPESSATDSGITTRDVLAEWNTLSRQTGFQFQLAAGSVSDGTEAGTMAGAPTGLISDIVSSSPADSAGAAADESGADAEAVSAATAPPAWLLAMFPGLSASLKPDEPTAAGSEGASPGDVPAESAVSPVAGAGVPVAPEFVKALFATKQGTDAGMQGDRGPVSLPTDASKASQLATGGVAAGTALATGAIASTRSPSLPELADVVPVTESAGRDVEDSSSGEPALIAGLAGLVNPLAPQSPISPQASVSTQSPGLPVTVTAPGQATDSVRAAGNLPAIGAVETHPNDQSMERSPEDRPLALAGPQDADSTPSDNSSRIATAGWQQSGAREPGAVAGAPLEATVSPWDRRQFADRLSDLVLQSHDAGQQMSVRVTPPDLGAIVINVQSGQDGLNIRLEASSSDTQQLLTDNLSQLQESLSQLGRPAERIDIVHGDRNYSSPFGFGSDQASGFHQPSQQQAEPVWRPEPVPEPANGVAPEGPKSVASGLPSRMQELNIKV